MLHDIELTRQCRLLGGKKQFLTKLTPVPSCCWIYSFLLSVNIPLSSPLCSCSQYSALQSPVLCHIKITMLSLSRAQKIRLSYLHTSYFAGLSLRRLPVDPQSLLIRTVVQQMSAANKPQFYIKFRPSFSYV